MSLQRKKKKLLRVSALTIAFIVRSVVVLITEAAVNTVFLTTPLILCAIELFTGVWLSYGNSVERMRQGQISHRNVFSRTLFCQLAKSKHTTLQSWAPICDVQPQNRAGSLIGCNGRAQHAIGWSVEAEVVDAGGEKRLRVRVQVTVTEWTAGVGDDATELRVFSHVGTVVQSITPVIICGSTSGKDLSLTLGQTIFPWPPQAQQNYR